MVEIQSSWLTRFEYLLIVFTAGFSILIICFALYLLRILKRKCNFDCTPSLFVYLLSLLLGCLALFAEYLFLLLVSPLLISSQISSSAAQLIFWSGLLPGSLLPATPITVLFLSIDRLLIILMPMVSQRKSIKTAIAASSVAAVLGLFALNFIVNLLDRPDEQNEDCISFGCLSSDASRLIYGINRVLVAIPNFVFGTIFLALLLGHRRRLERSGTVVTITPAPNSTTPSCKTNSRKMGDRLALWVVVFEFLFDLLPNLVNFVLTTLDINISAYVGAFRSLTYCAYAFSSAIAHTTLLRRIFASNEVKPAAKPNNVPCKMYQTTGPAPIKSGPWM